MQYYFCTCVYPYVFFRQRGTPNDKSDWRMFSTYKTNVVSAVEAYMRLKVSESLRVLQADWLSSETGDDPHT